MIRLDYAILLPYLLSSFLLVMLSNYFLKGQNIDPANSANIPSELISFYVLGWILTLLAQATTIFMAQISIRKKMPDIAESFTQALKKFPLLFILLFLAMLISVSLGVILKQLLKTFFIYAAIPLGMFLLLFFQLFPVIIFVEKASFLNYFKLTFNFIKNTMPNIIRFFLSISIISLFSILLLAALDTAGGMGKELVSPLLQGLSGALITLISVIFYFEAKSTISVNA